MSAANDYTANRADLAALLGRSLPTVDAWVRQGCPVVERGGRGRQWRFNVPDVMRWRVDRAIADAVARVEGNGDTITREEADRRRAVAQAIAAERETEEKLRGLVQINDVLDQVTEKYAAIRAALHGVGARVAQQVAPLTSAPAIQEVVDGEVIETLEGIVDGR